MNGRKGKMQSDLEAEVAIITGSASGIGAATAHRLARRGVLLALVDQDQERIHVTAGEIAQATGQKPVAIVARVEQSGEINDAVTQVFDRFKRIDILVNSAGTSARIPFLELDEDIWDKVVNVNLRGTFLFCRAVAPIMVKRRKGAIVNISSGQALKGAVNGRTILRLRQA